MRTERPYNPPDENLARNIRKGRAGVHIVYFPSIKNSRVIVCESKLEADFCQHLEYDIDVVSYTPQPITIKLLVEAREVAYTPDFQVSYRYRPDEFKEVKPESVTSWDAYMELMQTANNHFRHQGLFFEMKTDTDIRREPFLSNLKYFYSKLTHVSEGECSYLLEVLGKMGGISTYGALLDHHQPPSIGSISKMLYARKIQIDLSLRLEHASEVTLS